MVDRVDDVSTAMSLFQIPAMAGFMMSYIGSLLESDLLVKISEYIPITSPFIMPRMSCSEKLPLPAGSCHLCCWQCLPWE